MWRELVPVPVGESHHDVERSQEEHEVKEGIAVGHTIPLVIHSPVRSVHLMEMVRGGAVLHQSRLIRGEGQLIYLRVVRVPDTEERKRTVE